MTGSVKKIAVLIDGHTNIGLNLARSFIDDGVKVIITGNNRDALGRAVAELGEDTSLMYRRTFTINDLDGLYSQVRNRYGLVNVLFVGAGEYPFVPFEVRVN